MASNEAADRAAKAIARAQTKTKRKSRRTGLTIDLELILHAVALIWYLRVWLWHFTPQASKLPGSRGFGWFTRYLTFDSFSLQLLQLIFCCLSKVMPESATQRRIAQWGDDLSCALFGLANAVTIMFYTLEATTKGMVEGGVIERPPWLGFAVHVSNSIFAWTDLLLARSRSFSKTSSRLSLLIVLAYTLWLLISSHFNAGFPYPFLNKMPWPQGFLGVMVAGQVLFYFLFKLGKLLRRILQHAKSQILVEDNVPSAAS